MKKTLLLVFIHGFKGGESTFGENYAFTEHLRLLVARELPRLDVKVLVYPKFETRGDLGECVGRFRDWLMNKVIDLEVAAGTASPTIDPSVRTILIGHSMGGIVAAETAIALTSEKPIHGSTDPARDDEKAAAAAPEDLHRPPTPSALMFPYIQGVLAFDTPYLGISPGVVAHGAESHYNTASAALTQLSGLGLWGGAAAAAGEASTQARKAPAAALPAPESTSQDKDKTKQQSSGGWGRWGSIAMAAGAVAAVAAGSAAAYYNREQITGGWTWATSHLEFVGCLARKEELRRRVAYMVRLNKDLGVGFGNLYTRLGKAAGSTTNSVVGTVMGNQRTFCVMPQREGAGDWRPAVNDKATDETLAHMTMFEPRENPGYQHLASEATGMIKAWLQNDWYESSSKDAIGS